MRLPVCASLSSWDVSGALSGDCFTEIMGPWKRDPEAPSR
ncbi:Hypothetical protein CAP_4820 [Chondromyces apiculatus DSM 436]|uniref:Uncharacterized protein n=1 Tax=Chondromyces apiculatus DSM 436 TaxID=1192034 RepID=A0A017T575_9BACT|nr:Hypothetical protein CAP_4820 [Chondromyces apiculatus DSM 436]